MAIIEVRVPDIGDFSNVPVIEVLVKVGDSIKVEQPLVTLESDKATMDVPSPLDGVGKQIAGNAGDKSVDGRRRKTRNSAGRSWSSGRADGGRVQRQRRSGLRNAGSWRRSRRLLRGVSQC